MKIEDMKPQVGIFEIIDDVMYVMARDVDFSKMRHISDDAGEFFHRDLVRFIISRCSEEAKKRYSSARDGFLLFPRGRVCYNFNQDKYEIYGSRSTLSSKHLETIMRKFSLPRNKVIAYADPYYEI